MKVSVVIKHTQTAVLDIGDLPIRLITDLLTKNDGTFNGEWGLGDIRQSGEQWSVDTIEVTETAKK